MFGKLTAPAGHSVNGKADEQKTLRKDNRAFQVQQSFRPPACLLIITLERSTNYTVLLTHNFPKTDSLSEAQLGSPLTEWWATICRWQLVGTQACVLIFFSHSKQLSHPIGILVSVRGAMIRFLDWGLVVKGSHVRIQTRPLGIVLPSQGVIGHLAI